MTNKPRLLHVRCSQAEGRGDSPLAAFGEYTADGREWTIYACTACAVEVAIAQEPAEQPQIAAIVGALEAEDPACNYCGNYGHVADFCPERPGADLEDIARAVTGLGLNATLEYPGFILIDLGGARCAAFGTANPTWGADLTNREGEALGTIPMDPIPSDSEDVGAIATAIFSAVSRWQEGGAR